MIPAYDSPGRKRLQAIGEKGQRPSWANAMAGGDDWAREAHRVYGTDEGHIVGLTVSCNYFCCHFSNRMNRLADGDEYVVLLAAFKIR
jgi:hypothetical protein